MSVSRISDNEFATLYSVEINGKTYFGNHYKEENEFSVDFKVGDNHNNRVYDFLIDSGTYKDDDYRLPIFNEFWNKVREFELNK